MSNHEKTDQGFSPEIRRARIGQLTIFDVTESELDIVEKGSPDSIYLNFAIFLLSTAISLTVVLLTTVINSNRVLMVFVVCIVVGYSGGALLLLLWCRSRNSVTDCIRAIRKRQPPDGFAKPFSKDEPKKRTRA
jgi:hypothetical protein